MLTNKKQNKQASNENRINFKEPLKTVSWWYDWYDIPAYEVKKGEMP